MTLREDTTQAGAVVALLERGVGRAVPKRDNAGAQRIVAWESAGAGGFDSRSLAEIVVKDGVQIPDCGASRLASALVVEGGLTAGKDRHQQLLTRRLLVVCFSAPNGPGKLTKEAPR